MKVTDIWKTSETFTMEMKVLRPTVKFHINLQNTGWLFSVYIQSYVISLHTPSVCLRSLHSLCIGVVIFRTLGEILTPTEVKSNLSSGINECRIPATHFVYIRLHQIHVVFMFVSFHLGLSSANVKISTSGKLSCLLCSTWFIRMKSWEKERIASW